MSQKCEVLPDLIPRARGDLQRLTQGLVF